MSQLLHKTGFIVYNAVVGISIRRHSEEAVTRRTRNAFVGSNRHEGSNPSVSVKHCACLGDSEQNPCKLEFAGFLLFSQGL